MKNSIKTQLKNINKTVLLKLANQYPNDLSDQDSFKKIYHYVINDPKFVNITTGYIDKIKAEADKDYKKVLAERFNFIKNWLLDIANISENLDSSDILKVQIYDICASSYSIGKTYNYESHQIIDMDDDCQLVTTNEVGLRSYNWKINIYKKRWICGKSYIPFPDDCP